MSAVRQVAEGAAGPQATPWCAGRESSRSPTPMRAAVAGCRGCGVYSPGQLWRRTPAGRAPPPPAGRAADVSRSVVTHGGGHGMGQGRRGGGGDDEQGPKRFD